LKKRSHLLAETMMKITPLSLLFLLGLWTSPSVLVEAKASILEKKNELAEQEDEESHGETKAWSFRREIVVISDKMYHPNTNPFDAFPPLDTPRAYKNVIVLIPDGCDPAVQSLAAWYKGGPLAVDQLHRTFVSTGMANSFITGSAAAATAFATGHKTTVRFLGIGPRREDLMSIYDPEEMPPA
jgi:alkaline phosphatase